MTLNPYVANLKGWDHVGAITPNVEYCEATRPHGQFKPAAWLPIARQDKHYEQYFVVSAGQPVAFTRQGDLVPAGLKALFAANTSGTVLTYVAADVTEGVINLATGVTCTVTTVTADALATALIARGLLDLGERAEDFISYPVGVAPYNYLKWCGGDGSNPADFVQHNYNMQHQVAILCKYVIEVPLIPAAIAVVTPDSGNTITDNEQVDWTSGQTHGQWVSATGLAKSVRYAADIGAAPKNPNVVGLNLPKMNLAKSTAFLPWVIDDTASFVRERDSIAELTTLGDYFIDLDVGVILFWESAGNAKPVGIANHLHYYHYDSAATSVGTYACATGNLKPGDLVSVDANSCYVKAAATTITEVVAATYTATAATPSDAEWGVALTGAVTQAWKDQAGIIGQVLEVDTFPKDYLDRVKTGFPNATATLDKLPGSATGGLPTMVTYAGAADRTVKILLLK